MKKYNKPELKIENINLEDILTISLTKSFKEMDYNDFNWNDWE